MQSIPLLCEKRIPMKSSADTHAINRATIHPSDYAFAQSTDMAITFFEKMVKLRTTKIPTGNDS